VFRNFLILIYLGAVWGGAFTLIKFNLRTLGPITEMAARAVVAFIALIVLSLILKKDLKAGAENWFGYLVFALLGVVILWLSDSFGLEYISAGLASVLVAAAPLATFIITAFILREERKTFSNISGMIIGILGLILVIGLHNITTDGKVLLGVLLVAGGFVIFGINGVLAPRLVKAGDPIVTTTYYMGIGSVVLTALAFILESPTEMKWGTVNIAVEFVLGFIPTASGFAAFYYLIEKAGPFFATTTFYLMPVFGMLASVLFLGQKTDTSQIAGIAVVIIGLYLINREKFKKR